MLISPGRAGLKDTKTGLSIIFRKEAGITTIVIIRQQFGNQNFIISARERRLTFCCTTPLPLLATTMGEEII
ncbi:MAG: hypothetical protein VR65_11000 [Desulfobulbaceae bacterium BRH_c16a]|nr:MAG: hypothetical protein VR65_11000 [Desulfobulbaceae bacterium BRH_c16a]